MKQKATRMAAFMLTLMIIFTLLPFTVFSGEPVEAHHYDASSPFTDEVPMFTTPAAIRPADGTLFRVSFDTGYGNPIECMYVLAGTPVSYIIEQVNTTRPGYRLTGWNFIVWEIRAENQLINYHNTLIAQWMPLNQFTITFDSGDGGSYVPAVIVYEGTAFVDIVANIENPTRPGYTFETWRFATWDAIVCGGSHVVNYHNILIAVWSPIYLTIAFDMGLGDPIASMKVRFGINVQDILPCDEAYKTGYTLAGWVFISGIVVDASLGQNIYVNTTLVAIWEPIYLTIEFNMGDGTPIDSIQVRFGTNVQDILPCDETYKTGYTLAGWTFISGTVVDAGIKQNIYVNNTLVAIWEPIYLSIEFDMGDGNPINSIQVRFGTNVQGILPCDEAYKTGYTLTGWTFISGTAVDADMIQNIYVDNTLVAIWEPIYLTIEFDMGYGNPIDSIQVRFGTNVQDILPCDEAYKTDYILTGWEFISGTAVDADIEQNIYENNTLVAIWEAIPQPPAPPAPPSNDDDSDDEPVVGGTVHRQTNRPSIIDTPATNDAASDDAANDYVYIDDTQTPRTQYEEDVAVIIELPPASSEADDTNIVIDEAVTIDDMPLPLALMPQTGLTSLIVPLMIGLGLTILLVIFAAIKIRKTKINYV